MGVKLEVEVVVHESHSNNGYHILGTMNVQATFVHLFPSVKTVRLSWSGILNIYHHLDEDLVLFLLGVVNHTNIKYPPPLRLQHIQDNYVSTFGRHLLLAPHHLVRTSPKWVVSHLNTPYSINANYCGQRYYTHSTNRCHHLHRSLWFHSRNHI